MTQVDAKLLTADFPRNSIDAVVTEPYLSPPLYQRPGVTQIQKIQSELSSLYLSAFSEIAQILKVGGKVIVIFPVFETEGHLYFLEILERIKNLNLVQNDFFPTIPQNIIQTYLTKRDTILYGNKDQFLKREILSFTKK
jgi:tRNA G10  N-methylase Trm11